MKRIHIIIMVIFGMVMINAMAHATIRYVDGVGGQTNYYATISAAITAATAGDTIMVGPGLYSENNQEISVTKRVVLIGSGYRNLINGGTHIIGGFDLTASATGSKIIGFKFLNTARITAASGCNNLIIANNFFDGKSTTVLITGSGNTGDTIRNNIFFNGGLTVSGTNHVICNNILKGGWASGNYIYPIYIPASVTNLLIFNNIFSEISGVSYPYAIVIETCTYLAQIKIVSNVFSKVPNITNCDGSALFYGRNHFYNSGSGTQPTPNLPNSTGDPQFTLFTNSTFTYDDNEATDTDFHLQGGSPCIDGGYEENNFLANGLYQDDNLHGGLGTSVADCGIYGGPYPFPHPHGRPIFPVVKSMTTDKTVVTPGGTVQLNATGTIGSFPGK